MLSYETTLDMAVWEDASGVSIDYALDVLEDLRRLAVDGLNAFAHGGKEIGGVLYGRREESRIAVLSYAELECEHALGPRFVLSEKDHASMAHLMAPRDGFDAIGWFRAHTRNGLELDAKDRELFDRYFEQPLSAGLVLKPTQWGPATGAFYFRSASGEVGPDTVREFAIEPFRSNVTEESPAAPETPPAALAPAIAEQTISEPVVVAPSELARRNLSHAISRPRRSMALAMCGGVLVGALITLALQSGAARHAPADTHPAAAAAATVAEVPVTGSADRAAPSLPIPPAPPPIESEPLAPPPKNVAKPGPRQARIPRTAPVLSSAPVALPTPPAASLDFTAAPKLPDLALNPLLTAALTPASPAARKPAYTGPRKGRLIWTGDLARHGVIEIDGSRVSLGTLIGALPGVGLEIRVEPAEFRRDGLTVYTADMLRDGEAEPPSQSNGWNGLHFKSDAGRAHELVLLETPNAANDYKRLVVRNDGRPYSVLLVDWAVR